MADKHWFPPGEEEHHRPNSTCPCEPSPTNKPHGVYMTWVHKKLGNLYSLY